MGYLASPDCPGFVCVVLKTIIIKFSRHEGAGRRLKNLKWELHAVSCTSRVGSRGNLLQSRAVFALGKTDSYGCAHTTQTWLHAYGTCTVLILIVASQQCHASQARSAQPQAGSTRTVHVLLQSGILFEILYC